MSKFSVFIAPIAIAFLLGGIYAHLVAWEFERNYAIGVVMGLLIAGAIYEWLLSEAKIVEYSAGGR